MRLPKAEKTPLVFIITSAVILALFAAIPTQLWLYALPIRSGFQGEVQTTLQWLRQASAVGAVAMLFCLFPRIRMFLCSRWGVFLVPWGSIGLFFWYKDFAGPENGVYLMVVREDSLVEYLTALFLFGAAFMAARAAVRLASSKLVLAALFLTGMTGLTLFMGLEEISYGQRIFGIETPPEIAADNSQHELNLHNRRSLKWIAEDIAPQVIIKWGLFGWMIIAGSRLLPSSLGRIKRLTPFLFPSWEAAPYFIPFAAWAYRSEIPGLWPSAIWQDQEPAEMFLGLAFLIFCCMAFMRASNRRSQPEQAEEAVTVLETV